MIDYGHGVKLYPLDPANLEVYRQNRNDWRIRRWCRQRSLIDTYQQNDWFENQYEDPRIEMLEIHHKGLVGVCGFTDIDYHNRRAEFSLYINIDKQGQGYGAKGLETLVEWGFKDLNLNMIWGETIGRNPAEATFKKVGFVNTGYRSQFYWKDGEFHDSYIYCLDSDSYLSNLGKLDSDYSTSIKKITSTITALPTKPVKG